MMHLEPLTHEDQEKLKKSAHVLYAIFAWCLFSSFIIVPGIIIFLGIQLSVPVVLLLIAMFVAGNRFLFVHLIKRHKDLMQKDFQENQKEVHTGMIDKTKRMNGKNEAYIFTIEDVNFNVPVKVYNTAENGDTYRIEKPKYISNILYAIEKVDV